VALALVAREHDGRSASSCGNGNKLRLHNVASASGENALLMQRAFAIRAAALAVGVERSCGSPSDLWWGVVGELPEAVATR
jgi:hypothetical protein